MKIRIFAIAATIFLLANEANAAGGYRPSIDNSPADARSFSNSSVIEMAMKYEGRSNPTGTHGPWCRDFVNMILKMTGHQLKDNSRMAVNAVNLGSRAPMPLSGAIFVQNRRRGHGHTGFVIKPLNNGNFLAISGNHGRRVKVAVYSARGVRFVIPN